MNDDFDNAQTDRDALELAKLDEQIEVASGIEHVPDGAFISKIPISRKCKRCGHYPCPCCNGWCDLCLEPFDNDAYRREGDFYVFVEDPSHRIHVKCAEDYECEYDGEESEEHKKLWNRIYERARELTPNGGSFGVTDDGRVWFGPSAVTEEEKAEEARRAAMTPDEKEIERARNILRHCDAGRNTDFPRVQSSILRALLNTVDKYNVLRTRALAAVATASKVASGEEDCMTLTEQVSDMLKEEYVGHVGTDLTAAPVIMSARADVGVRDE